MTSDSGEENPLSGGARERSTRSPGGVWRRGASRELGAGSWEQGASRRSGGERRAGSWEQGAGSMERAEGRERRQALGVWSQGSTQEITPAILSDLNRIVKTR